MADGKRAPGTDDERAERLARMMAAQCTLEPPEKVGLKTGWRPSASGFGVTADGSSPGGGAAGLGAWTPPSTPGTPGADAQAPSPGGTAGVASPAAPFTFRVDSSGSGSGSGAAGVSSPAAPFTFRFDAQPAPAPAPEPAPEPEPEPEPPTSPRHVLAPDVPSAVLAAQRAYVAVAASSAGVDGAEVPRGGREVRVRTARVAPCTQTTAEMPDRKCLPDRIGNAVGAHDPFVRTGVHRAAPVLQALAADGRRGRRGRLIERTRHN